MVVRVWYEAAPRLIAQLAVAIPPSRRLDPVFTAWRKHRSIYFIICCNEIIYLYQLNPQTRKLPSL